MGTTHLPPPAPGEAELQAYVDDRLDAQRRLELETRLKQDAESARRASALRAQREALRAAFSGIAQETVPVRLNLERMIPARRRTARLRWQAAAAVSFAFAAGAVGGWAARDVATPQAGIAALANEASTGYAIYADDPTRPVEMGAERRAELVRWVSSRIRRPVAVPDLSASGYRFIGGRLLPTDHGPAGMFVYEDSSGRRIAMVVRPMNIDRNTPMMKEQHGRVAGFTWAHEGLGYSVVGADAAEALHPLADEIRRQLARGL